MCDGKNHPLETIYWTSEDRDTDHVVRWCPDCGAVVIDLDYDDRTDPGHVMPMRFPTSALKKS